MKKWIVTVEKKSGRKETRIVPARNKYTAISNCTYGEDKVVSCVPYAGQEIRPSAQTPEENYAHRGYTFGYGFGYEERKGVRVCRQR